MNDGSLLSDNQITTGVSDDTSNQDPNYNNQPTQARPIVSTDLPVDINEQTTSVLGGSDEGRTSSGGKEQKEAFAAPTFQEVQPASSEKKEFEIPPEVKDWMQQIEEGEEISFPGPIKDDFGQILMEAARITKPKLTLPLDDKGLKSGLQHKIVDSIRWMAEWCLRLIKMIPDRVTYNQSSAQVEPLSANEGDK